MSNTTSSDLSVTAQPMLIGGEWVESLEGEWDDIYNPATAEVIARVPRGSAADVDRAVDAAKRALPGWLETTPRERSNILLKMADILEANMELLGGLESDNAGKPRLQAIFDLELAADSIRFQATAARHLEGMSAGEYMRGYTSYVRREPIGIVAGIAPWNYPLAMAANKFAPALAAGNVQITKPSELTPLSMLKFAELVQNVLPPGVLQVVTGHGRPVGQRLVEHPDVAFVSLTGDVSTGKTIVRAGADSLTRMHLELGGNGPAVVFDDADLAAVKSVLASSFFNAGQACTAATRIIATPGVFEQVTQDLIDTAKTLKIGVPRDNPELDLGSLISFKQQRRVLGYLERAQDADAEILVGGDTLNNSGAFVRPTVVGNVNQGHEIVQHEVFGPVVTVQRADSVEQAYEWANDTRRRLAASVFTENHARAMDASRRLSFGTVWVNDAGLSTGELPHGGFGDSGYGKDLSRYSLDDYTQIKQVTHRVGPSIWSLGAEGLTNEGQMKLY